MLRFLLLAATALCASFPAFADNTSSPSPEYLTLSAGWFDVHDGDSDAAMAGLEYRGATFWHGFLPVAGLVLTEDGAYYGYGGINYDWNIFKGLYFTPGIAVAAFEDGGGKDLGGVIEFRSSVELSYRFPNDHRLGVSYQHMSNASLYDKNPGAENFLLTYSVPFSLFK